MQKKIVALVAIALMFGSFSPALAAQPATQTLCGITFKSAGLTVKKFVLPADEKPIVGECRFDLGSYRVTVLDQGTVKATKQDDSRVDEGYYDTFFELYAGEFDSLAKFLKSKKVNDLTFFTNAPSSNKQVMKILGPAKKPTGVMYSYHSAFDFPDWSLFFEAVVKSGNKLVLVQKDADLSVGNKAIAKAGGNISEKQYDALFDKARKTYFASKKKDMAALESFLMSVKK